MRPTHAGVFGMSVALARAGNVETACRGHASAEGPAVDPFTVFQAGSISKAVTAVGVVRLAQEGGLDLDRDVEDYLRSWHVPDTGGWRPRLTLRRLLSHTAGTTVHGFRGYAPGEAVPDVTEVLRGVAPANSAPVRVRLLPGSMWEYSGGGTTIVQQVLADVTGEPFEELMDSLVLTPAGMSASWFGGADRLPPANAVAGGHVGGRAVEGGWHVYPEQAAAGLWTTPRDLLAFADAVQRSLRGDDHALLHPSSAAQLVEPVAVESGPSPTAVGMFVEAVDGRAWWGHVGVNEGYVGRLLASTQHGDAVAVLSNNSQGGILVTQLAHALARGAALPEAMAELAQGEAGLFDAMADPTEGLVGRFETERGTAVCIEGDAHGLFASFGEQPPMRLTPLSPERWLTPLDAEIDFTVDDGVARALTVRQRGAEVVARRSDDLGSKARDDR